MAKTPQGKNPEMAYSNYFKLNRSIIDRLFIGQRETAVECSKCFVKSVTYDAFLDLQLDINDISL